MSVLLAVIGAMVLYALIRQDLKSKSKIDVEKMEIQLVEMLEKGGFQHEMTEGRITIIYRNERFMLSFDESHFGEQYVRLTVYKYYTLTGMDEVHPFVMDAVMARSTSNCPRVINMSFENSCVCYYSTDVNDIKDFYGGLKAVMDLIITNEEAVGRDFIRFHERFGQKRDEQDERHIGFRTSSDNREEEPAVAAETSMDVE